jgi:hypothetical protein
MIPRYVFDKSHHHFREYETVILHCWTDGLIIQELGCSKKYPSGELNFFVLCCFTLCNSDNLKTPKSRPWQGGLIL